MSEARGRTVARLRDGPLDVVGDVHGEFEALQALLGHLGYRSDGTHGDGRRAVFVGDLCDRGPDSPAVLDLVADWVQAGRAQAVLGNHEMNVLLGAPKYGNGWFFERDHDREDGVFLEAQSATQGSRDRWLEFLERLPLALEREDLRIVHACWDDAAIRALENSPVASSRNEAHRHYSDAVRALMRDSGIDGRAAREMNAWRHLFGDPEARLPLLPACAEEAELKQNANPLKVLTSGREHPAERPAFAGKKWRMTNRSRWWRDYVAAPAVLFGHYWRRDARAVSGAGETGWDDPLDDHAPYEWLGPRRNAFCLDYAVGGRYAERRRGVTGDFGGRLASMRWPERELVFDDGERISTGEQTLG